jgi:hypothetical protein
MSTELDSTDTETNGILPNFRHLQTTELFTYTSKQQQTNKQTKATTTTTSTSATIPEVRMASLNAEVK